MGVLGLLGGLGLFLLLAGTGIISQDETALTVLMLVAIFVAGLLALLSLPELLAGYGLLRMKNWGRILALILGVLNLPGFPIGTLLGIYTLWALLDDETQYMFSPAYPGEHPVTA
jgi:hypothetical protein